VTPEEKATKAEKQLHALGVFVHGVLTFGHLLGFAYNLLRRNPKDVAAHVFGACYSSNAVYNHVKDLKG
jgi:hypothetical protein